MLYGVAGHADVPGGLGNKIARDTGKETEGEVQEDGLGGTHSFSWSRGQLRRGLARWLGLVWEPPRTMSRMQTTEERPGHVWTLDAKQ